MMAANAGNGSQQRPPAPSLFIGPSPSVHSSSLDGRASGYEYSTQPLNRPVEAPFGGLFSEARAANHGMSMPTSKALRSSRPGQTIQKKTDATSQADSTWVDMQNTLEEVELNAASGASVFSSDHAQSLEGLRKAQIALAQAWAQSDADDEPQDETGGLASQNVTEVGQNWRNISARRGAIRTRESVEGSTNSDTGREAPSRDQAELEQETENDIMLARRRRQANDQYFDKVNRAVVDVVAKLETVAQKMREVETESQNIWGTEHDAA